MPAPTKGHPRYEEWKGELRERRQAAAAAKRKAAARAELADDIRSMERQIDEKSRRLTDYMHRICARLLFLL